MRQSAAGAAPAQFVALMRAVNVAGHARVKMGAVREAFAAAGGQNVRTIVQSGNILFDCPARSCARTMAAVTRQLREVLGEEPQIMLRTVAEITALVERAPFARYARTPRVKFYVAFLAAPPRQAPALPIADDKEKLEAIALVGREAFIVSRLKTNGFFGFPNNFIEEQLGIAATTRNWSTVTRIATLSR